MQARHAQHAEHDTCESPHQPDTNTANWSAPRRAASASARLDGPAAVLAHAVARLQQKYPPPGALKGAGRCETCGAESEARPNLLACGVCGSGLTRIVSGEDLTLMSIELITN
mgnify:CR=1 FL=1